MIWMTWRQHRSDAAVGAAVVLAAAASLGPLGITARSKVRQLGLTACLRTGSNCGPALAHLHRDYHWLPPAAATLVALPVLAGMFWGAPLIAGEIERGTDRLVWTQSVSRLRWISTKLALILGIAAAATLGVSLLAAWAFQPLIPVFGNRFQGDWFDVQGIVPVAYMLFALALGSCIGAIWRRTIPAMATTMVAYAAVRVAVHNLRPHLLSANVKTVSKFIGNEPIGLGPGAWILSQHPTGAATSGPPTTGPPATTFRYVLDGRFWSLQAVEAAIFLVLAVAFVAVCVWVVVRGRRNRRSHRARLAIVSSQPAV